MRIFNYLLLITLLFSACNSDKKHYTIGVSQCSQDSWRAKMNSELQREAYLYDGVTLKTVSAEDNSQEQIKQIEQLVRDGIDLLIVSPNDAKSIVPVINEVYDRGIPVVLVDRAAETSKYTAYIGADNTQIGREVAEHIVATLGEKGSVLEIYGLEESTSARQRHKGFSEVMAQHPGIVVTNGGYGDWFEKKAEQLTDSVLSTGQHFDVVFGHCDRMAVGAHRAANKRGVNDMKYVGIDALAISGGGVESVDKGILDATFIYPTRGDLIMALAMKILEGKHFERENILYSGMVNKQNARTLLNQSSEVQVLDAQLETLRGKVDLFLQQYNNQKIILFLAVAFIVLLIASTCLLYWAYAQKLSLSERLQRYIDSIRKVNEDVLTAPTTEEALQNLSLPNVEENDGGTTEPQFIKDFRNIINERLADSDLSVETLSSDMGMSRVQLYRKVKALTGSTPVELVRVARLKRADRLLRNTDKTVSEICYQVGFSSPSYFTKCYKDYFGRLPKEH